MPARELQPGMSFEWKRDITEEDIRLFTEISGDRGVHHTRKDPQDRLLAQGLLTATMPTKLGGDLDFLARTMSFEFLAPVYSGDVLACRGVVDSIVAQTTRWKVKLSFVVVNQAGTSVMKGFSIGMILR